MKRLIWIITAAALLVFAAGCGKKEEPVDEYALRYSGAGEIIDTGEIKAVCPTGWTNVTAYDLEESAKEPVNYILEFVKGAESLAEDKPVLKIVKHQTSEGFTPLQQDLYEEPYEVTAFTAGKNTWKGFSALSGGQRFVYVTTVSGDVALEAWLYTHQNEAVQAEITDKDVFMILESIVV